jgi:hypothetical protein
MTSRLTEIGRCCEIKMNVEKSKVMRVTRETSTVQVMIRSETTGGCGMYQLFG